MDKITKLPWKIKKIFPEGLSYFYDADNNPLFRVKIKANAEYICLAVNNHERLVEIAKAYLKTLNPKFLDYQKIKKVINAVDGDGVRE